MKKLIMVIMVAVLAALPTIAQQQEWKSTSTLQGANGTYNAPITEVGALGVQEMATTTTENNAPAKAPGRLRRLPGDLNNPGSQSNESPIGDAVLPMAMMAVLFAAVLSLRRRKMMSKE